MGSIPEDAIPKSAIVHVTSSDDDNPYFGTSFVVHLEESGTYLITCSHVVKDVGGRGKVRVGGRPAKVVVDDSELDVAVLYVEERLNLSFLVLCPTADSENAFATIGFRKLREQLLTKPLHGRLGKEGGIYSRQDSEGSCAWDLILEDDDTLMPGYSGSPVINENGECIAIVRYREGTGERGIAISVEALSKIWEDRPGQIMPDTARSEDNASASDSRWVNRTEELNAFERIVSGEDNDARVYVLHGPSGMGKTELLDKFERMAQNQGWDVLRISLALQNRVDGYIDEIVDFFPPDYFTQYRELVMQGSPATIHEVAVWHRNLARSFFDEFRQQRIGSRVAIFVDQFEKADGPFQKWLNEEFLIRLVRLNTLIVVVAGQDEACPLLKNDESQPRYELSGISMKEYDRAGASNVPTDRQIVEAVHKALKGVPKLFMDYLKGEKAGARHE